MIGEVNDDGDLELIYESSSEFQKVFDQAQKAYKRSFDREEHLCKICMRNLLGDKFFFLSGCEHYFCLECLTAQIVEKIKSGKVNQLICGEFECKKPLNDLDIRNIGLDEELFQKYEQQSLNNAIAQMDDIGWCPLPGCKSIANIERAEN